MLPSRSGAGLIPWDNTLTPYLREIMDCLAPHHPAHRVVFMGSAQAGKTEVGNNWIGYVIAHAPGPMLIVTQTQEGARKFSKQRLQPMIDATPALRGQVLEARSRAAGNSMFYKEFEGGQLMMTWASSPAGLRMMPTRYVFGDEVDGWPGDVGGEGDPVALAERGTATFVDWKAFYSSTPTTKNHSRIEKLFELTDQRRFFVPCPHCGEMDWLEFRRRMAWEERNPATARIRCLSCGEMIEEHHKTWMMANGVWRPTAESRDGSVGFHVNSLYAPLGWKHTWASITAEFLQAKENPTELKVWVNHKLGETYEDRNEEAVEPTSLAARAEIFPAEVPVGVGVLVASVDTQGDRLEYLVIGYGASEESWRIATGQVDGDPGDDRTWAQLDDVLAQEFTHQSGRRMRIECVVIDTGGHHTDQVYRYCRLRMSRRVFAIKGGTEQGKPLVSRPSRGNRYRVPLFVLCVDTGKETVYGRLRIGAPGPGYMHMNAGFDGQYYEQLCAEKRVYRWVKGRGSVRSWEKLKKGRRNEALDMEVYCLAALYISGPALLKDLPRRAAYYAQPPGEGTESSRCEPRKVVSSHDPPEVRGKMRAAGHRPTGWMRRLPN